MNIILQNSTTEQYLCAAETGVRWSEQPDQASSFPSGVDAFDFCRAQRLTRMNIVLSFKDSTYNVKVRVRDSSLRSLNG